MVAKIEKATFVVEGADSYEHLTCVRYIALLLRIVPIHSVLAFSEVPRFSTSFPAAA